MPRTLLALVTMLPLLGACTSPEPGQVRVVSSRAVEFDAVVTAGAFAGAGDMSGYHLVVWDGGGAAGQALLRARVTDVQVLDALEALGAVPGDGLRIDTWDDRHDAGSPAPDRVIAGPAVRVEIHVPGRAQPLGLEDLLEDPGARGFAMRFGGHRANIPEWHSGCVVCLYSCPGSKVGNAAYTVRDFVQSATHFSLRPGALPANGTEVAVRLVLEEPAGA